MDVTLTLSSGKSKLINSNSISNGNDANSMMYKKYAFLEKTNSIQDEEEKVKVIQIEQKILKRRNLPLSHLLMRERNNTFVADSQITKIGSLDKDRTVGAYRNSISAPILGHDTKFKKDETKDFKQPINIEMKETSTQLEQNLSSSPSCLGLPLPNQVIKYRGSKEVTSIIYVDETERPVLICTNLDKSDSNRNQRARVFYVGNHR